MLQKSLTTTAIQITIKTGKIYNYTIGLVVAMGILPISAHSNIASAQEQEQTGTLVMAKEDEIDSFDDLAGMTLDLSDKNICEILYGLQQN